METAKVKYLGDLRTECVHIQSGTKIITDAPLDNNGKGESFSPTDLIATSYASCMLTIMGIYAKQNNICFDYAEASVTKVMGANPRKISEIIIKMDLSKNNWTDKESIKMINVGKNCPVAKTLEGNINVEFEFVV